MMMQKALLVSGFVSFFALPVWADNASHTSGHSSYAGFQNREIKSLSASDIKDIRQGRGWGLALPAELNGLPGPAHILELRDELGLSGDQVAKIETIFNEMREQAIKAGAKFIAAERALNNALADKSLDQSRLTFLVAESGRTRAELRNVHLSRHLVTPKILTPQQIQRYAVLRGYQNNPCSHVPKGHDKEMWRRHNNCE